MTTHLRRQRAMVRAAARLAQHRGALAGAAHLYDPARLQGLGVAPPIAGRSPSYLMRQLYEIQSGIRAGAKVAPMKVAIAALSADDLLAVAAWAASLR